MNAHRLYYAVIPQAAIITPGRAHGIDISKYDKYFLPAEIVNQLDFVIQRVSYGLTRDEAFTLLVPGVMQIPIRGGYHYLSSWYTWREQADKYLSYIVPYQYHFHVCDFEGAFNTLSTGFAFSAWEYIHYIQRQTGKPCLLYTNPSTYNQYIHPSQKAFSINWNEVELWLAQYFFIPNPNGTPSTPTGRTRPWKLWQYTSQANGTLYGVARSDACDLDVYNGTVEQMRQWLGLSPTTPPADVVTEKYAGLKRISGTRHGWNFELFISDPSDPKKIRYEAVCLAPLDTVSRVRARNGATLAVNGGEWDRVASLKDFGVSNGGVCKTRVEPVPSLMVTNTNKIVIDHKPTIGVRQALSGLRYLIVDGAILPYLSGTDPQYTEGHARSIHGVTAQGHHMVLQSRGVYPNQGLTLKQAAEIMKQYGAVTAFDSGGGGDVSCNFDGESLILTENINNGQHFERPLPQVFLIYAGGTTMTYGTAREKLGNTSKIRSTPSRYGADLGSINPGSTIEFVRVVPVQVSGTADNPADQWFELPGGGKYVNYILSGVEYYTILTQPTPDEPPPPPPPPTTDIEYITVHFTDGTTKKYLPE